MMATAWVLVLVALSFDFINGFHDAANSIATVVSTRVLTPRQAVAWAAFFNFAGFLVFGTKVAETISQVTVPGTFTNASLFAALFGATFFTTAPLSSTLVAMLFGPAHHGAIFGAANLFHHGAGALGSYAGGLVFDLAGSYRPIFLVAALVVVGSAAVTSLARRSGSSIA